MTLRDMMRGRAPPHFHTGTGTGTASGSAEKEAERETRRENGDAPAHGTGGGGPGVETRMNDAGPGRGARTKTETESDEAVGAGSEHEGSGSEKRSFEVVEEEVVAAVAVETWLNPLKLVMQLLMTGLLESLVLMGLMAQRRRAGIETGSDVGVTGARGNVVGTETGIGIESTNGGRGAVSGAGMRPGVGVAVVRTMGWKG